MADSDWRAQRGAAALAHQRALDERTRRETEQARALIAQFLIDVRSRGVAPVPLHARGYDGRGRYRTGLEGWYLRRNETVALGTDGNFYTLQVDGGLLALVKGAHPEPKDPPLVLGKGGKDGESIDLAEALARVLGDSAGPLT